MDSLIDEISQYTPFLKEIWRRLVRVLIVFAVGFLFGLFFNTNIIYFFFKTFNFSGVNIILTTPTQIIELPIYTGIVMGLLLAFPYLTYQVFAFIRPALKEKEYRFLKTLLPINVFLFISGVILGVVMVQIIITLSSRYSAIFHLGNLWDIKKFFSLTFFIVIINGLIFQLPVVLTGLIRSRLIKRATLVSKKKYIYAFLIVFVALLPPIDLVSDIILTVPLILLFEIALLLNRNQE